MSMRYTPADRSRFELARQRINELVRSAPQGKTYSLVLMTDPVRILVGEPTSGDELLAEVDGLTPDDTAIDLGAAFNRIVEVLDASPIPQKEVLILSDLQASSWRPADGSVADALAGPLDQLAEREVRTVLIDVGSRESPNAAVVGLRVLDPVVVPGSEITVEADVANFGDSVVPGVTLELRVDGRRLREQAFDVPPGEPLTRTFTLRIDEPGEHVLEAEIDTDNLVADNLRTLVVTAEPELPVLLVDGDRRPGAFASETDYLRQAISPTVRDEEDPDWLVEPEVITETALAGRLLERGRSRFSVVVLCNVAQLSPADVRAIETHLDQGGGLVVFTGEQVDEANYNRRLHRDGEGPLPARIGTVQGGRGGAPESLRLAFDPLDFRHPLVAPYAGQESTVAAGLTEVRTFGYHQLELPESSDAEVALRFENGDPAVVTAQVGQGRVIQLATTADVDWTSWPLRFSYAPIMEEIMIRSSAGRRAVRNGRVGQPLAWIPDDPAIRIVEVRDPAGETRNLAADADRGPVLIDDVRTAGVYRLRGEDEQGQARGVPARFAVRTDPAESDLRATTSEQLQEAYPGWAYLYLENSVGLDSSVVSRQGELHRGLLLALIALLLLETGLAWYHGRHALGRAVTGPAAPNLARA